MSLILHAGTRRAPIEEIKALPEPQGLGARHVPVPHGVLIDLLREKADKAGLHFRKEEHALTQDNATYFGVFDLAGPGDWAVSLGLRNNHTRRMSAAMCFGQRVFVCDNLAFHGEHEVFRRHTREILRDLGQEIEGALHKVEPMHAAFERRVAAYKGRELVAPEMARLCRALVLQEAIPEKAWPKIFMHWNPGFEGSTLPLPADHSAWGFYNAITQVLTPRAERPVTPGYVERTAEITAVFDAFAGMN